MVTPTRRPWRAYLRLSLRSLIVIVLLIGGTLGWIVHQAKVQHEAVATITRAGGVVYLRLAGAEGWPDPLYHKVLGTNWLVKQVGIDYFGHVARIDLLRGDRIGT